MLERLKDRCVSALRRATGQRECGVQIKGWVKWELRGPDGQLKGQGEDHNLVTSQGDAFIASTLWQARVAPLGMKLGTASTAPSKGGAGSYIAAADYVAGSAQAFDATFPKQGGSPNIASFSVVYAAGTATNAALYRVAIVDNNTNAGEADATHTFAIAQLTNAPVNKGAADTLTVTWTITCTGA
jgi:hypothetical protein